MSNFTLIDRVVLESLNKGPKTLTCLQEDTLLPINICNRVLESLLTKNFITIQQNQYEINKNLSNDIVSEFNNSDQHQLEVRALITECLHMKDIRSSYYKVNMKKEEKIILNTLFYNLESFLKNLKKNKGATKDETFIYWGEANYAKAIYSYLN